LPSDKDKVRPSIDGIGLLLLSPGLALFLFGVSSSAEESTFSVPKVYLPMIFGALLVIGFVFHALRSKNPLIDLRLFKNRTLMVSVLTMVTFMIAFFGSSLLYPQYFIGVRGETTLIAGLLLAPQGIGAMLTMPIAGKMTDKMGPGKFVLGGLVLLVIGVGAFVFLGPDTSYLYLCGALFIQGLGMGMTMMPIMSAALATLKPEQVNDGSTLVNVVQQTASSIGSAVITVVYTGLLTAGATLAIGSNVAPDMVPTDVPQGVLDLGFDDAASAFATTFIISTVLVALTLIPAFFLPRKKIAQAEGVETPVLAH
ncbi:MFS transporter, partial [Gordonia sp. HY442]